ncbi:MAG: hypothetical protein JST85_13300 [Acidobacteria bacterium]|nr:hypothetical protein [Acidobacteriota bacterium]
MGFIIRCVLVLLVFSFVIYVLKAIVRLSAHLRMTVKDVKTMREQLSGRQTGSAEMVRCLSCGAFVASRDALTVSSRNSSQVFCSHECLAAHAKSV